MKVMQLREICVLCSLLCSCKFESTCRCLSSPLTHSHIAIYKQQRALTNGRHALREFTRRTVQYIHPLLIYVDRERTALSCKPLRKFVPFKFILWLFGFVALDGCRARTVQKKIFVFYENKTDDGISMGERWGAEEVTILHWNFRFLCSSRYLCCCLLTIHDGSSSYGKEKNGELALIWNYSMLIYLHEQYIECIYVHLSWVLRYIGREVNTRRPT